jgi:hypothetical protein
MPFIQNVKKVKNRPILFCVVYFAVLKVLFIEANPYANKVIKA